MTNVYKADIDDQLVVNSSFELKLQVVHTNVANCLSDT